MRQPSDRRNSKEWNGKKLSTFIPLNLLQTRVPPDHKYPIPKHETLIRIIGNRRIQRGVSDCDTSRRGNHPPNMLIRLVPHLDPEGQIARNVVQVRIGYCRSNSSTRKYASELAPQRLFDASRSCSSTVRVWSWPSPSSMRTNGERRGALSQAATFCILEAEHATTRRSPQRLLALSPGPA